MKIRKATKKDFAEFEKLKKESIIEYSKLIKEKINLTEGQIKKEFGEFFTSKKRILLIVERPEVVGYLIGTLIISSYQKVGYMDDIFITKQYRRNGVGSSLINFFMDLLDKKKIKKAKLGVNLKNNKARKLYKKLGFKITHYDMERRIK